MTVEITAVTSSKIVHFFSDLIFDYFDMENTYRHVDVGKMLSTQSAAKIQITHAEHYRESVNLGFFLNKHF